jgi:sugar lactone lactonase YvrE
VADHGNNVIRKITPSGVVTTFAGTGGFGMNNGAGASATFLLPAAIAIDSLDNLYVSEVFSSDIRKITPGAIVSTFATLPAADAGLAVDSGDNLFAAVPLDNTIKKISSVGVVSDFAGDVSSTSGSSDGTGAGARFDHPTGVAIDSLDNLYVADNANNTIRKVTPGAVVTTIAGGVGLTGSTNGIGSAARFNSPSDIAVDSQKNIYVGDMYNHSIRKITPGGLVTNALGVPGKAGIRPGEISKALINNPIGLAIKGSRLYITTENSVVWFPVP